MANGFCNPDAPNRWRIVQPVFFLMSLVALACHQTPAGAASHTPAHVPDNPAAASSDTDPISDTLPQPVKTDSDGKAEKDETSRSEDFEIVRRDESYETFIDIKPRDGDVPSIDWRPRSKQLFIAWDRNKLLSEQTTALRDMIAALAATDDAGALAEALVHVPLDMFSCPEYVNRLARFAATDPSWLSPAKQPPPHPDPAWGVSSYIVRVTESAHLLPELDVILSPLAVQAHLDGVEKCSTARPGARNELGRRLEEMDIHSRQKLPVGCLMSWFKLIPAAQVE